MSNFPCHMLGLCVKISHLRHKSHTQFVPPGAAICVILRLSRAPRNKLNQAMWDRGAWGEEGRAGVRVEFLMLLLVKFWTVHLYRPTCRIICCGGLHRHSYRNETANCYVRKKYFILRACSTHNNENHQMLLSRKQMCFIFGALGSDISVWRYLILTNASVIFWVSADKCQVIMYCKRQSNTTIHTVWGQGYMFRPWNSHLQAFVILPE
jgi:hypothetical protein